MCCEHSILSMRINFVDNQIPKLFTFKFSCFNQLHPSQASKENTHRIVARSADDEKYRCLSNSENGLKCAAIVLVQRFSPT